MKVSKKGEYALRAMIVLSLNYNREPLQIKEVSKREAIPVKFLEQILLDLKKAGLLESKRGAKGGYRLIKHPKDITLAKVIRTIDGPLAPVGCVSQLAHVKCPREKHCKLKSTMLDVRNSISEILEGVTFEDICKKH